MQLLTQDHVDSSLPEQLRMQMHDVSLIRFTEHVLQHTGRGYPIFVITKTAGWDEAKCNLLWPASPTPTQRHRLLNCHKPDRPDWTLSSPLYDHQ